MKRESVRENRDCEDVSEEVTNGYGVVWIANGERHKSGRGQRDKWRIAGYVLWCSDYTLREKRVVRSDQEISKDGGAGLGMLD